MLDVERIDLATLAEALEDHSFETAWWFDPSTGQVEPWSSDPYLTEEDHEDPEDRGLVPIDALPSHDGYRDMEDFIAQVRAPRARDLLERAIQGRGAFRRFKDTLLDFPELREAWFAFHDVRMARRAIRWLAQAGLIDEKVKAREISRRPDPDLPSLGGAFDPRAVVSAVAADLRALYGTRLQHVTLFGSWARGDAHPESDIDLLVVLDRVESVWDELRKMEPVLWRHSLESDTVISAVPVSGADLGTTRSPFLRRAEAEGSRVA